MSDDYNPDAIAASPGFLLSATIAKGQYIWSIKIQSEFWAVFYDGQPIFLHKPTKFLHKLSNGRPKASQTIFHHKRAAQECVRRLNKVFDTEKFTCKKVTLS